MDVPVALVNPPPEFKGVSCTLTWILEKRIVNIEYRLQPGFCYTTKSDAGGITWMPR